MSDGGEREFNPRAAFDAIEAERGAVGFSQSELTRAADINEGTYAALKRDPSRVPRARTVYRLQNALQRLRSRVGAAE